MSAYYGAVHSVNGCFIYLHIYIYIYIFLALTLKRVGKHSVVPLTVFLHKWRQQYNRQVHNCFSE